MTLPRLAFATLLALTSFSASAIDAAPAVRVKPLLKTTTSWNGNPIVYPTGQGEVTGLIVEIAPGGETGWHEHPVPNFGLLLEGELEITLLDGRKKRMQPGEALAEVVNTPHNGRNVGTTPVRIVVFYAGAVGTPVSAKHPGPELPKLEPRP